MLDALGVDWVDVAAFSVIPIVVHEINHIETSLLQRTILTRRAQEERADDRAFRALAENLRMRLEEPSPVAAFISSQSILAVAKYLRDRALLAAFDGFRGLAAEDLLLAFQHRECSAADLDQPAFTLARLDAAWWDRTPLMDRKEFDRIASAARAQLASHPHSLTRSAELALLVQEQVEIDMLAAVGHYDRLRQAWADGDPRAIWTEDDGLRIGVSQERLFEGLEDQIDLVDAVNCPDGFCRIGAFRRVRGFMEIVGPASDLRDVKVVAPLRSDDNAEAIASARMINGLFTNLGVPDQGRHVIQHVREILRRCGVVGESFSGPAFNLDIRSLNDSDWVAIQVFPSEATTMGPDGPQSTPLTSPDSGAQPARNRWPARGATSRTLWASLARLRQLSRDVISSALRGHELFRTS
jgi:hypothetical protein